MKLTKDTKNLLKVGTILKDTCNMFTIVDIWQAGRALYLQTRTADGFNLYGLPVSKYYGVEIVKL